jgi:hypothetical protein
LPDLGKRIAAAAALALAVAAVALVPDTLVRCLLALVSGGGGALAALLLLRPRLVGQAAPASAPPGPRSATARAEAAGLPSLPPVIDPFLVGQAKSQHELLTAWVDVGRRIGADLQTLTRTEAVWEGTRRTLVGLGGDARFLQENSQRTFDIADNLARTADQAFALADQMQKTIAGLSDELDQSIRETESLLEESKRIAHILEVMNEISSKTHVLSINASIVAARAGSHGVAFDVVAREIRQLARGTEESLQGIEALIQQIQDGIHHVASRTRETSNSILEQKNSLLSVAGVLQGVILSVEVIRTTSNVSSDKAGEQENGISDVVQRLAASVADDARIKAELDELGELESKAAELGRLFDQSRRNQP